MREEDCAAFLQWALPRLRLRWAGFSRVRRQVCRRIHRRLSEIRLESLDQYRIRLEVDPHEWLVLDSLCHITISRFYRDKRIFELFATVPSDPLLVGWMRIRRGSVHAEDPLGPRGQTEEHKGSNLRFA